MESCLEVKLHTAELTYCTVDSGLPGDVKVGKTWAPILAVPHSSCVTLEK